MAREWTEEQRKAASDRAKARHAAKKRVEAVWTDDQKQAATEAMGKRNEAEKTADTKERVRVPIGTKRDITAVRDQDPDYQYRWANDVPGRIDRLRLAGYEPVESAKIGDSNVDGTHNENGVVSRDMGKGTTAILMKQRKDWFLKDQAEKQKIVDESEEEMRRDINEKRDDGRYGEVKIN